MLHIWSHTYSLSHTISQLTHNKLALTHILTFKLHAHTHIYHTTHSHTYSYRYKATHIHITHSLVLIAEVKQTRREKGFA